MLKLPYVPSALFTLMLCFFTIPPLNAEDASTEKILRELELEELAEPIALYPDVILKAILPASTFPDQIVDAALMVKNATDAPKIKEQQWDQSVKTVAKYPGVLKMMFDNIKWTTDLGKAYVSEHSELMGALQRARTRALSLGKLKSNQYQTVKTETNKSGDKVIFVQPTTPEAIYIPQESAVAENQPPPATPQAQTNQPEKGADSALVPLATLGAGMALGASLDEDDEYYYDGYWAEPFWGHEEDNFSQWADQRRDAWQDYNDRRWDQQKFNQAARMDRREFRQDAVQQGQWPRQGDRAQAQEGSRTQATTPFAPSSAERNWGDSDAWSKPRNAQSLQGSGGRPGNGSAFQGYQSGGTVSAMSGRGAASRGISAPSRGGGGGRGGGGRR